MDSFAGMKDASNLGTGTHQPYQNHQISNLRGSHDLPQPKAAKPDLWDGAMLSPSRDAKNVSWGH